PGAGRELTDAGHRVVVEQGAGLGSSIADQEFEKSGATVLETADEVWGEADLILQVSPPRRASAPQPRGHRGPAEERHPRGGLRDGRAGRRPPAPARPDERGRR